MHILAVFAHPDPNSFNRALLDLVVTESATKGHECVVRDLYAQQFNPSLCMEDFESFNRGITPPDIEAEQAAVSKADVIFFIHPIWWFGPPAIFKGWVDRVFSYGFAYGHDSRGVKPLLAGKKAIVINTAGGKESQGYDDSGFKDAIVKLNDVGIYRFVGLDLLLRRMFFQVPVAGETERREMLELVRSDLKKLL